MKKLIGFIFIITLCLLSLTPIKSNATMVPVPNSSISASSEEYSSKIADNRLFNSFDYSFLKQINYDLHLTSDNVIQTSLNPTQATINAYKYCYGNLCFEQTHYIVSVNVYYVYRSSTYNIYTYDYPSFKTISYDSNNCKTTNYVNNTITTSESLRYFIFTDYNKAKTFESNIDSFASDGNDLLIGSGSSINNAITNIATTWDGKLLAYLYTGTQNLTNTITSTCNNTQTTINECNSSISQTYSIYGYGKLLGNFTFSSGTTFIDGFSKCSIPSIGNSLENGKIYSFSLDFVSLSLAEQRNIWDKLTQINSTNEYEEQTLYITSDFTNGYIESGLDLNFQLNLVFKNSVTYIYNNAYFKFNSNTTNNVTNFFYGDFNLSINANENNKYYAYLLNEQSRINSENLYINSEMNFSGTTLFYLDYNFNITLLSDSFISQNLGENALYEDCKWYNVLCHLRNGISYIVYDLPIVSDFTKLAKSFIGVLTNTIELFIEYHEITFWSVVILTSLGIHFIKRSTK